jgi:hypothetical protein
MMAILPGENPQIRMATAKQYQNTKNAGKKDIHDAGP